MASTQRKGTKNCWTSTLLQGTIFTVPATPSSNSVNDIILYQLIEELTDSETFCFLPKMVELIFKVYNAIYLQSVHVVPADFREARSGWKGPVIIAMTSGLLQTPMEAAAAV